MSVCVIMTSDQTLPFTVFCRQTPYVYVNREQAIKDQCDGTKYEPLETELVMYA